jgi:hypothetical protein
MTKNARRIRPYSASLRRGFSFTEVLFAVMVLGIGFIMIAAMFPVTIQQTQSTLQESVGASVTRGAIAYLQTQATEQNFPVTAILDPVTKLYGPAQVVSMPQAISPSLARPGWFATRGNYINPINPRFAWVPLYLRSVSSTGEISPFAQVFIIALQSRNRPQYYDQFGVVGQPGSYSDLLPTNDPTGNWAPLEPRRVAVSLTYDAVNLRGRLTFTNGGASAAPGAYVIIADDRNANAPRNVIGQSTGRIYRLGNAVDEAAGIWSLAPDGDMIRANALSGGPVVVGDDNDLVNTDAYIVGRGYHDPSDPSQGYSGPAQDIAVYTGFIRINPPVTP